MVKTLFLGHSRSYQTPDVSIIYEDKHPHGQWVCLVQDASDNYYVCKRNNRKIKYIDVIEPSCDVDEIEFCDHYHYNGFHNFINAMNFVQYLLNTDNHRKLPTLYKSKQVRDSQREKVYNWELKFYTNNKTCIMNVEQTTDFIRQIESDFKITSQPIRLSFREKGGCYQRGLTEINIASYGQNRDIIIHEMAHWINSNINGRKNIAGHGPEFVGIFMLMLEYYNGCCLTDMINHAIDKNVKFKFPEGGLKSLMNQQKDNILCLAV